MKKENTPIISIQNIHYNYEDGTHALNGITFEINKGQKLAVIGSNGSGKSTLFLCLNGIYKPQQGKILYNGESISYSRKSLLQLRQKVGIVFQEPDNQMFCSGIYEELSFGLFNLGLEEKMVRQKVESVIDELEIRSFVNKAVHQLSGGQKKQVSIADVLVMEPEVIILDEPSSSLDPKHSEIVDNMIERLTEKGITVILSTHNMDRVLAWADKVIVLNEGRVLKEGVPEDIFLEDRLLEQANLRCPDILRIYRELIKKNKLDKTSQPPKSAAELETLIINNI